MPRVTVKRTKSSGAGAAKAIFTILVLLVLGPAMCWLYYQTMSPPTLTQPDTLDVAQVARNLADGKGFVTDIVRPLALQSISDFNKLPIPELSLGPLHLLVTAALFKIKGATDGPLAAASAIPLALTIPVIYLLGARLFSMRVGVLSVVVYVLAVRIIEVGISGTWYPLSAFIVSLMFLLLTYTWDGMKGKKGKKGVKDEKAPSLSSHIIDPSHSPVPSTSSDAADSAFSGRSDSSHPSHVSHLPWWAVVVSGVLLGVLYLADPQAWFLLFPLAAYILLRGGGRGLAWAQIGVMLGVALVAASPWLIRNAVVVGNPFFNLRGYELCMNNDTNTGFSLYRRFNVDVLPPFEYLLVNLMKGLGRLVAGIRTMQTDVLVYPDVYLSAAFLFGLLVPTNRDEVRRLKWVAAIAVAAGFLFAAMRHPSLTSSSITMYALSPIVTVFGIGAIVELVRRFDYHTFYENLILAVVPVLVAIPLLTLIGSSLVSGRQANVKYVPVTFETIAKEVPANIPIYTDSPWLLSWYGKHPAVWLPQRTSDIREVTALIPMEVGCLTVMLGRYTQEEDFGYWQNLFSKVQAPEGFQLVGVGPEGYIFARPGLLKPETQPEAPAPPSDSEAGGGGD